jgi:hypothetical protein
MSRYLQYDQFTQDLSFKTNKIRIREIQYLHYSWAMFMFAWLGKVSASPVSPLQGICAITSTVHVTLSFPCTIFPFLQLFRKKKPPSK